MDFRVTGLFPTAKSHKESSHPKIETGCASTKSLIYESVSAFKSQSFPKLAQFLDKRKAILNTKF